VDLALIPGRLILNPDLGFFPDTELVSPVFVEKDYRGGPHGQNFDRVSIPTPRGARLGLRDFGSVGADKVFDVGKLPPPIPKNHPLFKGKISHSFPHGVTPRGIETNQSWSENPRIKLLSRS